MVLDVIRENMASSVQIFMYGAINTYDTTTNGFYVIKFISYAYTLKSNTIIYGQVISAGKLVVKARYLRSIQENTNWYWKQQPLQRNIISPTRTIIHTRLDVIIIRYAKEIPRKLFIRNEAKKSNTKKSNYCD